MGLEGIEIEVLNFFVSVLNFQYTKITFQLNLSIRKAVNWSNYNNSGNTGIVYNSKSG